MIRRLAVPLTVLCLAPHLPAQAPRGLQVQPAARERRTALVIGNGAYREAPLRNPVADARAVAAALRDCGFEVDLVLDADRAAMLNAVREFGRRIAGGGVGLFYFAGHGVAVKGANYLVPVGTEIAAEHEVPVQALDVASVLGWMEAARNRVNLIILDACRNNPFPQSFRSASRGLAQMDAPAGSFIAYATAPGSVASDGQAGHGLYTQHLLEALDQPGLSVEQVFKRVRVAVKAASHDQQVPWDSSSLTGEFAFRPGTAAPAPALDPAALELAYWNSVKDSVAREDLQAYLDRYPGGTFADLARRRLEAARPVQDGAAAGLGTLQVTVAGGTGQVFLDGQAKGQAGPAAPLLLAGLPPGEAKVAVEAPDCLSEVRTVRIQPGQTAQAVLALRPAVRLVIYRKPRTAILESSKWTYEVHLDARKRAGIGNQEWVELPASLDEHVVKVVIPPAPHVHEMYQLTTALPVTRTPAPGRRFIRVRTELKGFIGLKLLVDEVDEATWRKDTSDSRQVPPSAP